MDNVRRGKERPQPGMEWVGPLPTDVPGFAEHADPQPAQDCLALFRTETDEGRGYLLGHVPCKLKNIALRAAKVPAVAAKRCRYDMEYTRRALYSRVAT